MKCTQGISRFRLWGGPPGPRPAPSSAQAGHKEFISCLRPALAAIILCAAFPAAAQQLSISGTVSDAQAPVPGVAVTLRDPAGSLHRTDTDGQGRYRFEPLASGTYELRFTQSGFDATTRTLSLTTAPATVDVTLSLAGISTTLQVTDVAGKATASRMDVPDRDIPAQVSSIPEALLQQQGTNDLATALRNASGASAQRFYGMYEYYTIRGFYQSDVLLVDGMRLEGNRFNTQLANVQEVEVLKGPSSILYGGGALNGAINLIRKKPEGTRSYDLYYKGGRFNTQQVGGGATGPLFSDKLLYRVDASFDHTNGWRGAGSDRFNVSPAVTWLIHPRARVTVHQAFNRDSFNGDGGLPLAVVALPDFDLSRRFSTPYDFGRVRDSQTNILFNANLSPSWEFRNSLFYRRTNDRYFVTEGLTYNPEAFAVDRYALYFQHHRRPLQNQADVVGRLRFLGMRHTVLAGYEYEDYYNYTDRTADGGDFFPTSISLATFQETQPPITSFPIAQVDYFSNRIQAFFWQDQISLLENLKINVGGRFDDYHRLSHSDPWTNAAAVSRGPDRELSQNAYTYRAGAVYELPAAQQLYFSAASSFQPVTTLPATGPQLDPERGQNFEFGHRWRGWNGRVQTSLAFYRLERNNVVISLGQGRYNQAGQQSSKGIDLDVNSDLGHGIRMIANYGYSLPRFDDYQSGGLDLSGNRPRYVPRHAVNAWVTKAWNSGFTAGIGMQYLGSMFTNNNDSILLGGWTTFRGTAGYRSRWWEVSVNAENLLNRQRYFFGSDYDDQVYPGAPINVFTTIRFRFR